MTMSPSSAAKAEPPSAVPHLHLAKETCPLCDQPLPPDRLEEMKQRIASRQEANDADITARLSTKFEHDKKQALDQARHEAAESLAREKEAYATREAAARAQERQAADAIA